MQKIKKLDSRGFAHHILIAVITVGVAVAGTYFIVFSKADTVANRIIVNINGSGLVSVLPTGKEKTVMVASSYASFSQNRPGLRLLRNEQVQNSTGKNVHVLSFTDNDGKNQKQIYETSKFVYTTNEAWSPDSKKVVFTQACATFVPECNNKQDSKIFALTLATKTIQQISNRDATDTNSYSQPHWSPVGTKVLYHNDSSGAWQIGDANKDSIVMLPTATFFANDVAWSSDATKIYFSDISNLNRCRINEYTVATKAVVTRFSRSLAACASYGLSVSPDNTSLAFIMKTKSSTSSSYEPEQLYTVPTTGGSATRTPLGSDAPLSSQWFQRQTITTSASAE